MENDTIANCFDTATFNESADSASLNDSYNYFPVVKQPVHMIIIYSIAYSLVFLLGLFGNGLIVWVVYRNPRMHSVTNYFIVNLAVADILVCLACLPMTLLQNLLSGWRFGAVMCKVTPFLQGVAVSASVNTLTAIALDRYLAICFTLEFRLTRRVARIVIMLIWTTAAAIMAPWVVYYRQRKIPSTVQILYVCEQSWPVEYGERVYFLCVIFLTCYTIPLVLISACYTFIGCRVWNRNAPGVANMSRVVYKSKMKVLKMLVAVVIVFTFSWMPLYALNVRFYFGPKMDVTGAEFALLTQTILPIAQWLGSFNSCVNPIIYCFFSKKFRRGYTELVNCCSSDALRRHSALNTNGGKFYSSLNGASGQTMYTSYFSHTARTKQKRDRKDVTPV